MEFIVILSMLGFYQLGLFLGGVDNKDEIITSGKTFKINDSTYKCKMINTLTYGEE